MERFTWVTMGVICLSILLGCAKYEDVAVMPTQPEPEFIISAQSHTIGSARYACAPILPFVSDGDIWMSTWGDDDKLYMTWGDGAGPAEGPDDPAFATDAGVAAFEGNIPNFTNDKSPFECVRSVHIPDGVAWGDSMQDDDKPSSLLCCDGRLYFAGHTPMGDPNYGYIAYSDNHGLTWTEVAGSPWTKAANSVFRILMFLNMGKNYELNTDGYVYAYGIGHEWDWDAETVYLCRVPKASITNYSAFSYYTGNDPAGHPIWAANQTQATPLPGLNSAQLGSAMYHAGSGNYLFLRLGELYAAPHPWGPWEGIHFLISEYDADWEGGYMPGIISKDAGDDWFYFSIAGQDSVIGYFLHLGIIEIQYTGAEN